MIQSLKDILVVSDMDGTLLTDDNRVLESTLQSIRLFTMLGGRFTVATGRGVESIAKYKQLCPLLSPVIAGGGTVIYDFKNASVLKNVSLPKKMAEKLLQDIQAKFPQLGVLVFGVDFRCYQVHASPHVQILLDDEQISVYSRPLEKLPYDWNKILFAAKPEVLQEVEAYLQDKLFAGIYFVHTSNIYYEVMPEGTSKGTALQELCAMLQVPLENTIVIGDYYNDLEMMQEAGHAVAVGNAPCDICLQASEVCRPNNEGGVGQFLYELVQRYGE